MRSVLVISLALGAPATALGNASEDELGASPRVKAMGGAGTALATDYAAVYYNPANLTRCESSSLSVVYDHVEYELRLDDTDNKPYKENMRALNAYTIGVCAKLPFGLAAGILFAQGLEHPAFLFQTTTNETPRFVRYGQRLENLSLMAAVGYQFFEGLGLGAGISILANSNVEVGTSLALLSRGRETPFRYGWEMGRAAAAHVGVHWSPMDELNLGLAYRSALFHHLDAAVPVTADIVALDVKGDVNLQVEAESWFTPHQVAIGATYDYQRWTFALDLTWYHWSQYAGPFISANADFDDAVIGYAEINPPPAEEPNFKDTVVPRLGAEHRFDNGLAGRVGYSFRPTPAPLPDRRANVLDSDSHMLSFGGSYRVELGSLFPTDGPQDAQEANAYLLVDAFGQFGFLHTREVDKGGTQPSLNDYTFGGYFWSAGLALTLGF